MKTHEWHSRLALALTLAVAALFFLACGDGGAPGPSAPDPVGQPRLGDGAATTLDDDASEEADALAPLRSVLTEAILREYYAEAAYRSVLAKFGHVTPFQAIAAAEAQHVGAVADLFLVRSMRVPANPFRGDEWPQFADLAEACAWALWVEEDIDRTYVDLRDAKGLPEDVRHVFAHMLDATQSHHMPAFQSCAAQ